MVKAGLTDRADNNLIATSFLHTLGKLCHILIDAICSTIALQNGFTLWLVSNSNTLTTANNLWQYGIEIVPRNANNLDGITLTILHLRMVCNRQTKNLACLDGIVSVKLVGIVGCAKHKHGTASISLQVVNS